MMRNFVIIFLVLAGCNGVPQLEEQIKNTEIATMNNRSSETSFLNGATISTELKLEWGKDIPELLKDALLFVGNGEGNYKMRQSVQVKISGEYKMILADKTLLVFDQKNEKQKPLELPPHKKVNTWNVLDMVIGAQKHIYVLEHYRMGTKKHNIIRSFDENHEEANVMEVPGKGKLFLANDKLFFYSQANTTVKLYEIDFNNSVPILHKEFNNIKYAFSNETGELFFVENNNQGTSLSLMRYEPSTGKIHDLDIQTPLQGPLGMDVKGNYFSIAGKQIRCTRTSGMLWNEKIFNIIPDTEARKYFISYLEETTSEMGIIEAEENGAFDKKISLPDTSQAVIQYNLNNSYLIKATDSKLVFHAILSENKVGYLIDYDRQKNEVLSAVTDLSEKYKTEFFLQAPSTWQLSANGEMFVPVLGGEYFYLLRLSF